MTTPSFGPPPYPPSGFLEPILLLLKSFELVQPESSICDVLGIKSTAVADSVPAVPKTPEFTSTRPLDEILDTNMSNPPFEDAFVPTIGNDVVNPVPKSVSPHTTTVPSSSGVSPVIRSFPLPPR